MFNLIRIDFFYLKIGTLKNARTICSTITQKGANLHELLGKELDARVRTITFLIRRYNHQFFKEARQDVMNRAMELTDVQGGVKEAEAAAKVCSIEVNRFPKNCFISSAN